MHKIKLTLIIPMIAALLAACGGQATPSPTISVSDVQTMAVSTFISNMTQTAQAMPTAVPTDTPIQTNTIVVFNTLSPFGASAGTPAAALGSPTASCYALVFKSDVTIPDDTPMTPGQQFTKTWLVQNTGSCNWQAGFKWTLISGNPMGGSTVTLSQIVAPGAQYQVSVPMIAPSTTGEAVGTWRMSDANGSFFGEAPWVKVMVNTQSAASTTAVSITSTATPSLTPGAGTP